MKPIHPSRALFGSILIALTASATLSAATYQWNGSGSSLWTEPTNWVPSGSFNAQTITAGPAPTGGTFAHRLNINNGTGNEAVYTAAQGTTVYAVGANRGLVIGSGTPNAGTFRITGGTFSTEGSTGGDVIGNAATTATLIVDGGNYIASANVLVGIGGGPTTTVTINSGSITIPTLSINNTTGTFNINGGTFSLNNITRGNGTNTINLNGGTIKPRITSATFLPDLVNTTVRVRAGGAIIDTSGDVGTGINATISEPLTADPSSPGGGLTKNGPGTLTLAATPTFTGPVAINAGTLALSSTSALTLNQAISGAGSLTTTGTVTLGGANTYAGPTLVNSGSLNLTGSLTSNLTIASGANLGGEGSTTGTITLAGTSTVSFNPSTTAALTAPSIDASAATLNFAVSGASAPATGAVVLQATTGTISGTVGVNFLSNGRTTLSLSGDSKQLLASYTPGTLLWKGGTPGTEAIWDLATSNNWDNAGNPDKFFGGDVVSFDDTSTHLDVVIAAGGVEPGAVTFANNNDFYTLAGGPILGSGVLTMNGTNELRLNAANLHTGGTVINSGTVVAPLTQSLGAGPVTVGAAGTLNLTSTANGDFGYVGTSNALSGSGVVNVSLGTATATRLFNGNNSGFTGTLNIGIAASAGAGKTQINSPLGNATVNILQHASIFLTGTASTQSATLNLLGGDTGESLGQLRLDNDASWTGTVNLAGPISGTNDGSIGSFQGTGTISGPINETGGSRPLIKVGAGKIISSSANGYTGATQVLGGALNIRHIDGLSGAGTTVANNAALELEGGLNMPAESLSITGQGISSTGVLRSISGNNTWNGPITAAGLIRIASDADLLTLNSSISHSGTGTTNDLLVLQGSGNIAVNGTISGNTQLTGSASGNGTRTLNTANTHIGLTLVNGGNLVVAHAEALGATTAGTTVAGETLGGTLSLTGNITVAGESLNLGGRKDGFIDSPHLSNLADNNTWTGNIALTFGGFDYNLESQSGLLTLTGTITGPGLTGTRLIKLSGNGDGEIANAISQAGSTATFAITKLGTGTWTLSGSNTNTGNTLIQDGTLTLAPTGQLRFVPTTNNTTNSVSGTGSFIAGGTFLLDLTTTDATPGNEWLIVDPTNLTTLTYGENFAVTSTLGAFSNDGGNWSITHEDKTWTFNQTTGTLSVAEASGTDYDAWSSSFDLAGGAEADDDFDGLTNFQEYAFGLNPTSASSVNPISQPLDQSTGTFAYTRRATPATSGLTYLYESSTTLASGDWAPFTPESQTSNSATPVEEITVELPAALLTSPTLFIRVRATQP